MILFFIKFIVNFHNINNENLDKTIFGLVKKVLRSVFLK